MIEVFKGVGRCCLPGLVIFADIVSLWYSGDSLSMNICIGPVLLYAVEKDTWELLLPKPCRDALM